ncbi:golgi nucleotide sugar transporter 2 [Arabidopsis thaliana]|uniref:Golgi nucleotide sugar transporter 2 n=1 Tax=Arabidopsis thaliana TaxID=3702 RepID=A0A2H1ZEA3_ARATH|nr:golgi nucleotide sugar transporter 2 [Arabidopsis thaliana]AEE28103.2 golgi nucleotide sugar transporter 2 [Arabidopsis thaliana]|eukprot:NP_001318940.1 golgi nucleotide sugar transporter 2 [Arabidopsis thaliana]
MSAVKLEAIVCHEPDESELSHLSDNGSKTKNGVVFQLLDQKSSEHRWFSERFLRWRRRYLPVDGDNRRDHGSVKQSGPLVSGAAYCISSCSMIILNKIVLSSYNFNAGVSLMLYQNLISCLVVAVLDISGVVSVEKFNWKLIRVWMPVNVIFVGMLVSGMYRNRGGIHVPQKAEQQGLGCNVHDDHFCNQRRYHGSHIRCSRVTWQLANCFLTASYSLTLRRVMDKAKQSTKSGSLNEVSMVLLNNLLSIPFGIILIILLGEWRYVISTDVTKDSMFWVVATASGFLGLAISFTSMWFLHQTGPTTYSLVGSLNKVPISLAGLVLFNVPLSLPNLFSILFGLFAGVVFARAKMS